MEDVRLHFKLLALPMCGQSWEMCHVGHSELELNLCFGTFTWVLRNSPSPFAHT